MHLWRTDVEPFTRGRRVAPGGTRCVTSTATCSPWLIDSFRSSTQAVAHAREVAHKRRSRCVSTLSLMSLTSLCFGVHLYTKKDSRIYLLKISMCDVPSCL
jgi:hypothetical protein